MNKLSRLLQEYMSNEELSVNDIANRIDVPPSVIHRVVYNQSIDIDTLLKITDLIGVPIEEILVEMTNFFVSNLTGIWFMASVALYRGD